MSKYVEGRIPISGWTYLIIGSLVAFYAKFIELKDPNNTPMILFFYIGIGLGIRGLGKLAFKAMTKKEAEKEQEEEKKYTKQLHQQQQQWQQQQQPIAQHNIITCACGARNYSNSHFCHRCGSRLK